MKTLTSDQQEELQELLMILDSSNLPLDLGVKATITFWRGELKPKRVRRNPLDNT